MLSRVQKSQGYPFWQHIYIDIRSVPVGHRETILRMKVQRIECKECGCIRQEKIHFVTWYEYHISTGKTEGINNKIKTMKQQAYGYRDEKFFELKILSLHEGQGIGAIKQVAHHSAAGATNLLQQLSHLKVVVPNTI